MQPLNNGLGSVTEAAQCAFLPFGDDLMTRQSGTHSGSGVYLYRAMFFGSAAVPQSRWSFYMKTKRHLSEKG